MRCLFLLLTLFACPLWGQEPAAAKLPCNACEHQGFQPCRRHSKQELELEAQVQFCSVAADCSVCAGCLSTDCKICANEPVQNAALERRQKVQAWLQARRQLVDQHCKAKRLVHVQSPHVQLAFSLEAMKVGKKKFSTHQLAHLYLRRIEDLRRDFMQVLQLKERDLRAPIQVFMFARQEDHKQVAPRVARGSGGGSGLKYMGEAMVYCMWKDRQTMRSDADVHRNMRHNVAHLLLNHMLDYQVLYNRKHGWLDAGLAHYFEFRCDQLCNNFCFEEVGLELNKGFKNGKWRVAVRKLVEAGKLIPFLEIYQLNTDQLSLQAHAQSFAYVEFLLSQDVDGKRGGKRGGKSGSKHGARMRALIAALKAPRSETRQALASVYDIQVLDFDARFQEWVKETYPLRRP